VRRAFLYKIPLDDPVRRNCVPEFFNPLYPVPAGKARPVVNFTQKTGNCRSGRFVQMKVHAEIFYREPVLRMSRVFHIPFEKIGNLRMTGHSTYHLFSDLHPEQTRSAAKPFLHTAMMIADRAATGSAAAGIAKFFRGRAGFPVAGGARAVPVLLAAGAGMQRDILFFVTGCRTVVVCCVCAVWHSVIIRTGAYDNYSYAHKSLKPLYFDMGYDPRLIAPERITQTAAPKAKIYPYHDMNGSL
jgi:hypothetical protein